MNLTNCCRAARRGVCKTWTVALLLAALCCGASVSLAQEGPPRRPKGDAPPPESRQPAARRPDAPPPDARPGEGFPPGEAGPRGPRRPPGEGRPPDGPPDRPRLEGDTQHFPPGPEFSPDRGGRRPPPGGPHMPPHEWQRLEQDDPEMYALLVEDGKLERETFEAAGRFRRAKGDEREEFKTELANIVARHFETRQKRRELQLKRMEEEIQRLREAIAARNEAREKIVGERIQQLLGEVDPLDF